jgi:hypothetical protein
MNKPELVTAIADLVGFIGALFLAVPFFIGQEPRDTVLLALARPSSEQTAIDRTTQRHVQHIARYWHWEARSARLGISLIALAFVARLGASIYQLCGAG